MKTLVIEDNPRMANAIGKGLTAAGHVCDVCISGREGEEQAASGEYDVIVLDVMLQDHDGMDLCRNLRRREVRTPILMLTALSGTKDKIAGLDAGADDYLTKPFDFEELLARLRALTRRVTDLDSALLRYADIEIDMPRRRVTREGKYVELTNKQFVLLEYLVRNPDRVLSRAVLGQNVWDMNFDPFSNVIDVHIAALRKKIDRPFEKPLIHTITGVGYMFSSTPPQGSAPDEPNLEES
jgi:DNA-binding response OmpR family regulator